MPALSEIVSTLRSFRSLTFRQLLRSPSVCTLRERIALAGGATALIVGLALVATGAYLRATTPIPAVGGTYVEGLVGEPHLVNPIFAPANDVDVDLATILFPGLFRTDAFGAVVPDLAERYDVSADGKTVTVVLRPNIRWHDGAELTSDDVAFTIRLLQDPNVGSPLRSAFRGITVERTDAREIRFTLERPLAVFLNALTVGILPEHLWAGIPPAHLALAELNLRPIGAGPYRFVGLTKDKRGSVRSYTLERYVGFHRTPAHLERVTFRFFPDLNQLIAALNGREVDGIGTFAPDTAAAVTRTDVVARAARLPQVSALFLNQRKNAALRDPKVREALDRAIDRRAVTGGNGASEPVGGPIIPGFAPDANPPPPTPFDRGRSGAILDSARWVETSAADYVAAKTRAALDALDAERRKAARARGSRTAPPVPTDAERADIETKVRGELADCTGCPDLPYLRVQKGTALAITIVTADLPELVTAGSGIRDAWRAVGIQASLDAVPMDRLRAEVIPNRAYDVLLFSQILGPDPDPFPFWHSSQTRHPGVNLSTFSNRTMDKLLEDARATLDRAVRAQKYAAFQKLLAEERPALFLTTPAFAYPMARSVRGVTIGALTQPSDRFTSITEWYTETERVWKR